jgi:hypothetical protein
VPAQSHCPLYGGYGGIGDECAKYAGESIAKGVFPVSVSFPPGIQGDHIVFVPLERFGIRNMYLAVNFRPTSIDEI